MVTGTLSPVVPGDIGYVVAGAPQLMQTLLLDADAEVRKESPRLFESHSTTESSFSRPITQFTKVSGVATVFAISIIIFNCSTWK